MNTFFTRFTLTVLLLVSLPTQAITISFNPITSTTTVGSSFDVALVISDLGIGVAPSLGVFDLELSFNPAIIDISSLFFGDPLLGDQLDLSGMGSFNNVVTQGVGLVEIFELSYDTPDDLNRLQADKFTLATLSFSGISAGVSSLGVIPISIGDANGDSLAVNVMNASVIVSSVPEPATWTLLGLSALIMTPFTLRKLSMLGGANQQKASNSEHSSDFYKSIIC